MLFLPAFADEFVENFRLQTIRKMLAQGIQLEIEAHILQTTVLETLIKQID